MTRRWWPGAICLILYVVATVIEFGPSHSLSANHLVGTDNPDAALQIWSLGWAEFALAHGHIPFFSQWQAYPTGVNVVDTTSMLGLGTIFSPVTAIFGPVVTWNVVARLAVILSSLSMCLVLRRWTDWWPAAFIGGLIYGFSSYITFSVGHLFLYFAPLPPIMFLLLYEILVSQRWRAARTGAGLGVLCGLQYLISSEILASTVLMGAIATAIYLFATRRSLKSKWPYIKRAVVWSLVVGGLLLIVPVGYTVFGPEHINGAPQSQATLGKLHGDLLSPIVPTHKNLIAGGFGAVSGKVTSSGNGALLYLGLPLLLAVVAFVIWLRRNRIIQFAAVMAAVAFVLSLGSPLYVDGRNTHVPLPFVVLAHLPLLDGFLAVRFSLFTTIFCAVIVAIGFDQLYRRVKESTRLRGLSLPWKAAMATLLTLALAAIITIPLLPRIEHTAANTGVSPFFSSSAVTTIPNGSVVLAYPYPRAPKNHNAPTDPVDQALLDQAVSGMHFKLVGGYGWWPVQGSPYPSAPTLKPKSIESLFDTAYYGKGSPARTKSVLQRDLTAATEKFLRNNHIDAVVVLPLGKHPAVVAHVITLAIGAPTHTGGVLLWTNVQSRLGTEHQSQ